MTWQTPKTDWSVADGVRVTDFNRIEGNILELYNVDAARSDSTIYVSPSGNDTSGTGSSQQPYATISKALSVIAKNLNGKAVTVNIAAGTYNEEVVVDGFSNGTIKFSGSGTVTINKLSVLGGSILYIQSITIATTTTGTAVLVTDGSVLVDISSISVSGATIGLNVTNCGRAHIGGNLAIANCNTGVAVLNNGSAFIFQLTGSGNSTGMTASNGGTIAYGYNNATVTTVLVATSTGGRINTGSQAGTGGGGIL